MTDDRANAPHYRADEWKARFKAELIRLGFDEAFAEESAAANPPSDWSPYSPEDAAREEVSYGD